MYEPHRIVVIGAGIGGLATALRLAVQGCAVTVLDPHAAPGGKMRILPSAAGPVDAGPTVLTMRWVFEDLFAAAGSRLADHVTLEAEPVLARHFWPDGSQVDLHSDVEASAAAIQDFAGAKAARQYRRFADVARRLYAAFEAPVIRSAHPDLAGIARGLMRDPGLMWRTLPGLSLARALARDFDDPRLRQLYGRYATYVGGSPDRSPALLALVSDAERSGVWRVQGGMHRLAAAIAGLAVDRGAALVTGVAAARIVMQAGRAVAVIDSTGQRHDADAIVFAGDPAGLRRGLLGDAVQDAVSHRAVAPRSLSAEVYAFAATPGGPALSYHNVFFGADPATEFAPLNRGDWPLDPTIYVCAQDRGAGLVPPAIERFQTIMNAPPWQEIPCPPTTIETLARRGLSFTPTPQGLTQPQDFAALFAGSDGSLYGRSPQGTMAAFQRPTARTTIPGLYLAGGGAHPGAGVPMATLSARHAAEAMLSDLSSTSTSRPTAMPGGISTASATTDRAPSR